MKHLKKYIFGSLCVSSFFSLAALQADVPVQRAFASQAEDNRSYGSSLRGSSSSTITPTDTMNASGTAPGSVIIQRTPDLNRSVNVVSPSNQPTTSRYSTNGGHLDNRYEEELNAPERSTQRER